MDSMFMRAVRERCDAAIASGDLQPIVADQVLIEDGSLPFIVRWVAALADKDAAKDAAKTVLPGGPRDPNFNPFLPPDPALTVGPVGEHHVAILNKFPVCLHHLVLARREFAEQLSPLELIDFQALAQVQSDLGGLGFYNGGAAGGASQRHKHVQWIPEAQGNASLHDLRRGLPAGARPGECARHAALPLMHCFVRVRGGSGCDIDDSARSMHAAFDTAREVLGLTVDDQGLLPSCNMLVDGQWMLMLPRSREHFEGISLNALSYGGTIYVRHVDQIDAIRATGPLRVLAEVGVSNPPNGVTGADAGRSGNQVKNQ